MSTKNIILITLENAHETRALGDVISTLIDSLTDASAIHGDISMYGGLNISKDSPTNGLVNELVEFINNEVVAAHVKERLAEDDDVVRELPELAPSLKLVN